MITAREPGGSHLGGRGRGMGGADGPGVYLVVRARARPWLIRTQEYGKGADQQEQTECHQ